METQTSNWRAETRRQEQAKFEKGRLLALIEKAEASLKSGRPLSDQELEFLDKSLGAVKTAEPAQDLHTRVLTVRSKTNKVKLQVQAARREVKERNAQGASQRKEWLRQKAEVLKSKAEAREKWEAGRQESLRRAAELKARAESRRASEHGPLVDLKGGTEPAMPVEWVRRINAECAIAFAVERQEA